MNLALFDFDGTIVNADTYTNFLFYSTSKKRLAVGFILVLPFIGLYKLRLFSNAKLRAIITRVAFWNRDREIVYDIARKFAVEFLPTVTNPAALDRIAWHKARGDTVYVVSASLNAYLYYWCLEQGVRLICSEMASIGSRLTGGYVSGDCSGENKVKMVLNNVDISRYGKIYAYGDTHDDLPMLALAQESYLRWNKMDALTS